MNIPADPGVGVLHVRGGVAVHGQHFVVAEHVVAGAILRQVGVLDGADADGFGDLPGVPRRKVPGRPAWRRRWRDDRLAPADAFVEQTFQPDRFAGAGFERLAVFAQHRAEADVLQFDVGIIGLHSRAVANNCSKCRLCR